MTPRVKFEEGEWFALPLRVDGWGIGLIARTSVPYRIVHLLGYFFGPARPAIPTLENVVGLRAEDASLFGFFSRFAASLSRRMVFSSTVNVTFRAILREYYHITRIP